MLREQCASDQADGLRKLFTQRGSAVLQVFAPGGGQGALIANLSTALARFGREVLVVDATHGEVAQAMGIPARYELAHVAAGDKRLSDIVLAPAQSLRIVPAARALSKAKNLDHWLATLAGEFSPRPDLVILHHSVPLPCLNGDVLVAASPGFDAVTRTYADLKRMQRGSGRMHLLVARAADEQGARNLHCALDAAAQRFLGARIDWAGYVPHDVDMRHAEAVARPVFDINLGADSARALMALGRALENWKLPRLASFGQAAN